MKERYKMNHYHTCKSMRIYETTDLVGAVTMAKLFDGFVISESQKIWIIIL